MQKTKKLKLFFIMVVIFSLVFLGGFNPLANAASLQDAKDTISNSDHGASDVTHAITFVTGAAIPANGYISVTFPAGFDLSAATTTCPATMTGWANGQEIRCIATGGLVAAGAQAVTIATTTNPGTNGSYLISLVTKNSSDVEIENADVRVYIIDSINVSAAVDASLTLTMSGVNAGDIVNGATVTATSTASSTPFGTLSSSATSTVAQELSVGTNATDGYVVQVFQDHELQTAGGAVIHSFNNSPTGYGSTTPIAWQNPLNDLNNSVTWGHMGVTSNDVDAVTTAIKDYSDGKYAGLSGTNGLTVMTHNGPANGNTQNIGLARVAYSIKITDLQAAGDYSATLTYICTPQF